VKKKQQKQESVPDIEQLARLARLNILRMTTRAGSGHPTSSLSSVELLATLFFGGFFRAKPKQPSYENNDRFILSKGHAAPLLYALYAVAGIIPEKELWTLRKKKGRLQGHPMPDFPYAELPTGSLGQGLSAGIGLALNARFENLTYHTFVLLGDSEMAEGSVWEAIQLAGHEKLDNLIAIVDVNALGQSGPTMWGGNLQTYVNQVKDFGWQTLVVDGHNPKAIAKAYAAAMKEHRRPVMIIAKTVKGKGVSFIEGKWGWHGKVLSKKELARAEKELGVVNHKVRGHFVIPDALPITHIKAQKVQEPHYAQHALVAPRKAFGAGILRLAKAYPHMVVLDSEVRNSTFTEDFADERRGRFYQTYIAEQNMVGIATGLASRGLLPVLSTFAAFFTRAHDQIRMAQYTGTHQVYVGTHPGVAIGPDGASQMGLEDIGMFRALEKSIVLYPADAYATERLLQSALDAKGLVYIRATRGELPVLYNAKTVFSIGKSRTLLTSKKDRITLVAAGVTLHEALVAARTLATKHIAVRVIDLYSIKPIDAVTLRRAAKETGALLVVEDHRPEGGMAEAVRTALGTDAGAVHSLAVTGIPHSGSSEELLCAHGIDQKAIIKKVREIVTMKEH